MSKSFKTLFLWVFLVGTTAFLVVNAAPRRTIHRSIGFLQSHADQRNIEKIEIDGRRIQFKIRGDRQWIEAIGELDNQTLDQLQMSGVTPIIKSDSSMFDNIPYYLLGALGLLLGVLFFLKKVSSGSGGFNLMELSKSRAKVADDERKTTFADVGGCHEVKESLNDVVDFLKSPQRWLDAGVRLPRGILLEGPPGSGKTHIARAVAGETGSKFYVVAGSEFVELFVGVGAARVRDMFETASKNAPSIIFIDEIDAVGRRRGSGLGGSHDEREQTLNQLLVCLDGFKHDSRIVVIAATNRADILDKALLRPGRFDRRIKMPGLTRSDRAEILAIHTKGKPTSSDLSLDEIAGMTDGLHGADLEQLANEAGLLAVRRSSRDGSAPKITKDDFKTALQPRSSRKRLFDHVDAVLMESTSQLTEPTGRAVVRAVLTDGTLVEGDVIWADAMFIKVRRSDETDTVLVSKTQIVRLEPAPGTESVSQEDISPDQWAGVRSDTM